MGWRIFQVINKMLFFCGRYAVFGVGLITYVLVFVSCEKPSRIQNSTNQQLQTDVSQSVHAEGLPLPSPPADQEMAQEKTISTDVLSEQQVWESIVDGARADFSAALKQITSMFPSEGARNHARAKLVRALCQVKLDDLASYLKQIESGEAREEALGLVAADWAARDPVKLVNYALSHLDGKDKNSVAGTGVQAMIKNKKLDEVSFIIESMPYSKDRSWAIHQLSSSYGRQDLLGAISWADGLHLDEDRVEAYRQLLPYIAEQRGAFGLTEIANRFQDQDLRRNCIQLAVKALAQNDNLNQAVSWVKELPAKERVWAELQLVQTAADRDLAGWTKYVVEGISPGAQGQSIISIAQKQFNKSPSGAADWALSLPVKLQGDAIVTVVTEWYDTDSIALSEWINTMKAGAVKDRALGILASSLSRTDKNAAIDVAKKIGDVGRRNATLGDLNAR